MQKLAVNYENGLFKPRPLPSTILATKGAITSGPGTAQSAASKALKTLEFYPFCAKDTAAP